MRFPLSRRTVLLTGATGASLSLLSACGLRLDTPPDIPVLDAAEELRNRIARILETTSAAASDPESARSDLEAFSTAIGPVWAPPSEMATEPPPTEVPRTYVEAAEEVSSSVFGVIAQLHSATVPVLVDVAIGFALTAGARAPELIEKSEKLLLESPDQPASGASAGPESPSRRPTPGAEFTDVCTEILDRARAAGYGYERLAVRFEEKSPERAAAVARLETLGTLAGEMLERLGSADVEPPQDSPAWTLDPEPENVDSARELATGLEDSIASALLPWLRMDSAAALPLWSSARARSAFAPPLALRYTVTDTSADGDQR